jgi:large subunit ribosomal protein L16
MGKGKGAVEFWVARVKPGRIMFELGDVDEELARRAFALGAAKLPVKCKFVKRLNSDNGEA